MEPLRLHLDLLGGSEQGEVVQRLLALGASHLDVRPGPGDDPEAVVAGILERGGRELDHEWGDLPWQVFVDPSGNEFCVLAPSAV